MIVIANEFHYELYIALTRDSYILRLSKSQSLNGDPLMSFTPQDFVSKWMRVSAREKQSYQEHFIDLCHLVGHQMAHEDE